MKQANIEIVNLPSRPKYSIMPGEFLVLGRSSNADIMLSGDIAISRLHCKIFYDQQACWIEDLGSRNHTYVNKAKITCRPLENGDCIQLGRHILHFSFSKAVAPLIPPEQENFFLLKREDKLTGKIAVKLGLISQGVLKQCVKKQDMLAADGPYYPLEEILLQEGCIDKSQFQQIDDYKKDIPFQIPYYQLCDLIALGGMGRIYRAHPDDSDKWVAIKIFCETGENFRAQLEEQFRKEAAVMLEFKHKNIVSGIEFGESNCIYLVMEYIAGPTLQQYIKEQGGRLLPDQALEIVMQIAKALDYAHCHSVVHRDIKPENVLLTHQRVVKLCDFGLVKDVSCVQEQKEEKIFGTVAYMSPEQIRGDRDIDIRSDIYSLGAVFYRMVFGRIPFVGDSHKIRIQHLNQPLTFPNEGKGFQKMELARIIQKMMSKSPQTRYQSPVELLEELEATRQRFEQEDDIGGTAEVPLLDDPSSTGAIRFRPKRRRLLLAIAAILCIVITAGLGIWLYWVGQASSREYTAIKQSMENSQYDLARKQAKNFLSLHASSEFGPNVKKILQSCIYRKAKNAYDSKEFSQALGLCKDMLKINGDPDLESKARGLIEKMQLAEKQKSLVKQEEKDFQDILRLAEIAFEKGDLSTVQNSLSRLRTRYRDKISQPRVLHLSDRYRKRKRFQETLALVDTEIAAENLQKAQKLLQNSIALNDYRRREWEKRRSAIKRLKKRKRLAPYHYYTRTELPDMTTPVSPVVPVDLRKILIGCPVLRGHEINGVFLMAVAGYVHCFEVGGGKLVWSSYLGGQRVFWNFIRGWRQVEDSNEANQVLLCAPGKTSLKILAMSGDTVWEMELPAKVVGPPLCYSKEIFVPCENGYSYRISMTRGEIVGGFLSPSPLSLYAHESRLYVGNADRYVYVFNLSDGKLETRLPYRGHLLSPLFLFENCLITVSTTGETIVRFQPLNGDFTRDFTVYGLAREVYADKIGLIITSEEGIVALRFKTKNITPFDSFKIEGMRYARFLSKGRRLLAAGDRTRIYSLGGSGSKSVIWEYRGENSFPCQPWQSSGNYYFIAGKNQGERRGRAFFLQDAKRDLMWQRKVGVKVMSPAVLAKDHIWLSGDNGAVYRIENGEFSRSKLLLSNNHSQARLLHLPRRKKILVIRAAGPPWIFDYRGKGRAWKTKQIPFAGLTGIAQRSEKMLFIAHQNHVKVLSLKSGRSYCRFRRPKDVHFSTSPTYFKKSIYIGGKDGKLYRLGLRKMKNNKWVLLKKWSFATGAPIYSAPIVSGKRLYFGSDDGNFYCLDFRGKERWKVQCEQAIRSSPLVKKGRLYFGGDKGTLYALSQKNGKILWKKNLPGAIQTTPVYLNGKICVVTKSGACAAYKLKSGKKRWRLQLNGEIGVLFKCKNTLYATSNNGFLYAIDEK